MRKSVLILIPLLLISFGCTASHRTIFSPLEGISDAKLTPRTAPAKLSKEPEQNLKSKGYVHIGNITSSDETSSCWGDDCKNFTCSDKASSRDLTKDIVEAAASGGGDLVLLQQDRAVSSKPDSRQGKCLSSSSSQYTEQECSGGYGNVARVCRNVTKTRYTCTSWEYISGRTCVTTSFGSVWRNEPGLENRIAEVQKEIARVKREKEQIEKAVSDKKEQIANLEKAYENNLYINQKDDLKSVKVGDKYGFQDRSGKMVISPQFADTMHGFSEGVAVVSVGAKTQQKWGIIDKSGNWVVKPTHDSHMNKASNGMLVFRDKGKCGYLDTRGRIVIAPRFTTCWDFSEGLAAVKQGFVSKTVYINKQGKIVLETQFDYGGPFSDGMAVVKSGEKYGYIDKKGNVVIKPQFNDAKDFIKGIARAVKYEKSAYIFVYINKTGDIYMEKTVPKLF